MSAVNTGLQTAQYFTGTHVTTTVAIICLSNDEEVGAMALAIFDYCLTISQEVQLIWGRRWNIVRIAFTFTRYVTFIGAAMTTFAALADRSKYKSCVTFNYISTTSHMISIIAAEVLLVCRTYAFWQQSKKMLMWILFLAAICITGSIVPIAVNNLRSSAPGDTTGCVLYSGEAGAIQYSFVILLELVLMILTVYKRISFYQDSRGRLITILYCDGLVYMTCIIMASIANVFFGLFASAAYTAIMDVPQLVIHGVLASRILFNLRESDESDLPIVRRMFPLAHIHHTPPASGTMTTSD
ncbi:hypothetical protein EDB19DRAFT_2037378 [Suillus lakei]|nr:hypothetical protein EDB19DRAFT_2037378 [Suillus lakei]